MQSLILQKPRERSKSKSKFKKKKKHVQLLEVENIMLIIFEQGRESKYTLFTLKFVHKTNKDLFMSST